MKILEVDIVKRNKDTTVVKLLTDHTGKKVIQKEITVENKYLKERSGYAFLEHNYNDPKVKPVHIDDILK